MSKIAIIGAGSVVFTRNLCSDILLTPALQNSTISLMDIDPGRLAQAKDLIQSMIDYRGLKAKVEATTDQQQAVTDANYVVTTFQQGGLDAYKMDIEIPQKYGVEQCVGDTLGPGGVFRSLRTIPVLLDLCHDMDHVAAPDALLLNYVNPMAANCWAVAEGSGRPFVGLCHSVQGTSEMLAQWAGAPYEEVSYFCAGINHQSFFLNFRHGDEDLYPKIWEAVEREEIFATEPIRIEIMKHFGYFVTESSGHASEYMPYFRKTPKMIAEELIPLFKEKYNDKNSYGGSWWFGSGKTGGYLEHCLNRIDESQVEYKDMISGKTPPPAERTHEYGSYIIEAVETNVPTRINGNVPNWNLIDNLPEGCCVEVPCLVDSNGVQPTKVGALPPQLAALNRTAVNVQELIVEASLSGDTEAVYHAVMLDPLTGAVCTLPQIREMVAEMLQAQKQWLPQF